MEISSVNFFMAIENQSDGLVLIKEKLREKVLPKN